MRMLSPKEEKVYKKVKSAGLEGIRMDTFNASEVGCAGKLQQFGIAEIKKRYYPSAHLKTHQTRGKYIIIRGTVWAWMGIPKRTFEGLKSPGTCIICGRGAKPESNLCRWHKGAFHRWLNKIRNEREREP